MKKNLDITKPRYSEQILPVPRPVVLSEVVSEIPPYLIVLSDYLRIVIRVLFRIYRLGEKSRVAEGHELPRGGPGECPPLKKFFEMNMR